MVTNTKLLEMVSKVKKDNKVDYEVFLNELERILTDNVREEVAKSKGNKKPLQVVKDIIKNADKDALKNYHEFEYKGNTYKGFTEEHYAVASYDDFGYSKEENNPMRLSDFFSCEDNCNREFKIDIKDLKAFIKIHKDYKKNPYILEDGDFKIGFNPKFLLNVLSFTNSDTIKVSRPIDAAFCSNKDRSSIALVLPVKLK